MADPHAPAAASRRQRATRWITPSLVGAAAASTFSGVAGFAVTAVLGDVASTFGAPGSGDDLTAQIGLTGTTIGVALALIRLASIASLPASAVADRIGRRRTLLVALTVGLAVTALGAASPGFWWWVAAVALARPFLSTVNNLAGVVAAEETTASHRLWGLAVIGASYGLGAGVVPVLRGVMDGMSFRVATGLVLVLLLAVPAIARALHEPEVFERVAHPPLRLRTLGAVPASLRRRLAMLLLATGSLALATGPGFTYVVLYAEQVLGASSGTTALLVLAAGPVGGLGLLAGRWLGDHAGRRPAAAISLLATALGLVVAYGGTLAGLAVGYLVGIASASAFGPPIGALAAEAFPTQVRATVAGWATAAGVLGAVAGLAAFGMLADSSGEFGSAARTLAVVVAAGVLALLGLPETRGRELDEVL